MLDRLRAELVAAVRALAATPAPTLAAILTLAVAVGVNLAMAGLIGRALLSPPEHITDPAAVYTLQFNRAGEPSGTGGMTTTSYVSFRSIRDQVSALSRTAAFQRTSSTVVVDGDQHRVGSMLVTPSYFDLLGARPMLGAGMTGALDESTAPAAVLSYDFWRSTWAGDPGVIGRRFTIGGATYTVSGVMPRGFSGHSATDVDLWLPIGAAMQDSPGWDRDGFRRVVSILVRVADGQPPTAAQAQASAALSGTVVSARPILGADVAATEQRVAWWLGGVSALVLLIGLANAGTLLVVRAAKRRRDVAIRTALGASRRRLVLQACVEAAMIAAAATGVSLLLAPWLDEAVRRVLFPGLVTASGLARPTILAALGAGVLAAVVAAAANLWQLSSQARAQDFGAAARTSHHRSRMTTALLLLQTALSVLLLAGAAMFGASFYRLASQDFGMRMDGVVLVDFEEGPGSGSEIARDEALTNAIEPVRSLPGITRATPISSMPFSGFNVPPIAVPGHSEPPGAGKQLPFLIAATPEYFEILGVQILQGRALTAADERSAPVVVVNETMAKTVWPGESAVGKCIRIGFDPDFDPATAIGPPWPSAKVACREVVGVARDTRQRSLVPTEGEEHLMQYYVPRTQVPVPPFIQKSGPPIWGLLLQTSLDPDAIAPTVRRIVLGGHRDLPFVRVRPYTQLLERQLRPWRVGMTLLALFSALALAVAAVGLYAAFAHAVAERRREMAIRIAIGARPAAVLRMILREAVVVSSIGAAGGCAAAVFAGRWIQSLLFGTAPSDPLVLVSAAGIMLVVATAATLWPARVASTADPNALLRVQ